MYRILFKPSFIRQAKRLNKDQFQLLKRKVELLKNRNNHQALKVHKLHGRLAKFHSFSLDYSLRIIFKFESENLISFTEIGSHDIYK